MNATQREQLRIATIKNILDAQSMGLREDLALAFTKSAGFGSLDADTFKAELAYLEDKGLIAQKNRTISPENPIWRITATGRDFAAQSGIESDN